MISPASFLMPAAPDPSKATPSTVNSKESAVRLWAHECQRVFSDRFLQDGTDDEGRFREVRHMGRSCRVRKGMSVIAQNGPPVARRAGGEKLTCVGVKQDHEARRWVDGIDKSVLDSAKFFSCIHYRGPGSATRSVPLRGRGALPLHGTVLYPTLKESI